MKTKNTLEHEDKKTSADKTASVSRQRKDSLKKLISDYREIIRKEIDNLDCDTFKVDKLLHEYDLLIQENKNLLYGKTF